MHCNLFHRLRHYMTEAVMQFDVKNLMEIKKVKARDTFQFAFKDRVVNVSQVSTSPEYISGLMLIIKQTIVQRTNPFIELIHLRYHFKVALSRACTFTMSIPTYFIFGHNVLMHKISPR